MLEAGLDITDEVLELDETLFKAPAELELLERLKGPFARWLVSYGIVEAAAQATAERLPVYFVLALHDEWGQRAGQYAVLSEVVKTPFTQAQEGATRIRVEEGDARLFVDLSTGRRVAEVRRR